LTGITVSLLACDDLRMPRFADRFAERSAMGMLMRAAGAWLLVGLPVIAARIWWSVAAAIVIFVVAVTTYVAAAVRYMRHHRRQP
jgi:membrane protein YdbS with pleckstrin-like domain